MSNMIKYNNTTIFYIDFQYMSRENDWGRGYDEPKGTGFNLKI